MIHDSVSISIDILHPLIVWIMNSIVRLDVDSLVHTRSRRVKLAAMFMIMCVFFYDAFRHLQGIIVN